MKNLSSILMGTFFVVLLMAQAGSGVMIANYTAWQNEYTAADAYTVALWNFNADQITTVTGGHAASVIGTNPLWYANNQDTASTPSAARFISGGKFGGGFENYGGSVATNRARVNASTTSMVFPSEADPSLSVEFWVKFNDVSTSQYIFDNRKSGLNGYLINKTSSTATTTTPDSIQFSIGDDTKVIMAQSATLAWEANRWYHIAGTWDADDDKARLYRDGEQVAIELSSGSVIKGNISNPLTIGQRAVSSYSALNGVIDDLRVSSVAYEYTTIPEPATMLVLGFGGVMMLIRRK